MQAFLDRYRQYSNVNLLKIVARPDDYQPDAVTAAKAILSGRTVTQEEENEVDLHFQKIALDQSQKEHRVESYKKAIDEFIQPITRPETRLSPVKWLPLFLVLLAIQYVYQVGSTVLDIVKYIRFRAAFDWSLMYSLLGIGYFATIFYLLFKKRRWGWILLLADNIISCMLLLSQLYWMFGYPEGMAAFLWQFSLRAAFIYFLFRQDVAAYFNIESPMRGKIALASAGLGVLITLFLFGISN